MICSSVLAAETNNDDSPQDWRSSNVAERRVRNEPCSTGTKRGIGPLDGSREGTSQALQFHRGSFACCLVKWAKGELRRR